jgi:hypothetical protein
MSDLFHARVPSSPHTRGWSLSMGDAELHERVVPAHAGWSPVTDFTARRPAVVPAHAGSLGSDTVMCALFVVPACTGNALGP